MPKKLVIFIGSQLDDDSYSEANFLVRVRHSISWHIVSSPDASRVAKLASSRCGAPPHKHNFNPQFGLIET
jgi:hypothetical protein